MSDLIDRQALLKQIDIDSDGEPGYYGDTWKFIDTIKNMPNVHDLPKDTDTISRQAAIEALDEQIEQCDKSLSSFGISLKDEFAVKVERASLVTFRETLEYLPTAEPQRIKGKWALQSDDYHEYYECDQCGIAVGIDDIRNFCPNCGADMREVTT